MTSVAFYHLTRTGPEAAVAPLLGRTLQAGERAVVRLRDVAGIEALSSALWASEDPVWLPHGHAGVGEADLQPIWLTAADEVPNGARYLFLLGGAEAAGLERFERVFDLFDGRDDEAVQAARVRCSAAKAAGLGLAYWQQGEQGWVKR